MEERVIPGDTGKEVPPCVNSLLVKDSLLEVVEKIVAGEVSGFVIVTKRVDGGVCSYWDGLNLVEAIGMAEIMKDSLMEEIRQGMADIEDDGDDLAGDGV